MIPPTRMRETIAVALFVVSFTFSSVSAQADLRDLFLRRDIFQCGHHDCVENNDSRCRCRDLFSCSDPGFGPRRCGVDGDSACGCYRDTEGNARCTTGCSGTCTTSDDCPEGEYCVDLGTSSDICPPCADGGVLGEAYRVCSKLCPEPF